MFKEKLGIDDKDTKLLSLCMKQPEISQMELAKELAISQPSVNARIQKLKKKGLLSSSMGLDLSRTQLALARVDCTAPDADNLLSQLYGCSFFANGFIMSGKNNVSLFIAGANLKKIESIVNRHLRSNPSIKDISMSVVVSAARPFVCCLNLENELHHACEDPDTCKSCPMLHK
ncbi:Lrp/AsnC family transcriptional regulator [Candidatus Woesearchaeota archaeon]|nr:Lrp/AsnC family transcriptional regulator [Candidatus Woesearchaeota archaeon]